MKKLFLGAAIVGGLALLIGGCGRHPHHRKPNAERITQGLTKKLGLSAEQAAKTQALVQQLIDERQRWRGEGPSLLGELQQQFAASSFDAKALDKSLAGREKKLAQARALLVQKLAEFHAILTPEQRSKAAEALGKLQARWQAHAGKQP